ncbi:MAG: SWIM zinc finger family protein [Flavobacteriales bacterium]
MEFPLDGFEQHIDEKILSRGLKYYEDGAVEEPDEPEQGLFEAIVHGSEYYNVGVRVEDDAVTEHYCDCPYDGGPVCKHVVALIFHLQQGHLDLPVRAKRAESGMDPKGATSKKPTVAQQVDNALATVPHGELIAFVRDRCLEDAAFRRQFLVACMPGSIDQDHKDYLKQLRSELHATADRGGFIAWDDADAAGLVLDNLTEQARELHRKGHSTRALPMITAVIEAGAEAMQAADDSGGSLGGAIGEAMELLANIAADDHDEAFRRHLLSEVNRLLADREVRDVDFNEDLLPIAAELVRGEEEAAPLMVRLERMANDEYGGSGARNALLDLTRQFEGDEAAKALEERFLVFTDVRERAIREAIEAKDWRRAKQLAEEGSKVMRNGRPATYDHYWTHHLLEIAQRANDGAEVLRLARMLLLEDPRDGMKHYKLLQQTVPAREWPAYLVELIAALRTRWGAGNRLLANICAAEERWNEVMAVVREEDRAASIYNSVLDQYEKELVKQFPREVATMLAHRAEAHASMVNPKRQNYVDAVKLLRRVIKAGDRQLADALVADWRVRLARRSGLMEELGNL